MLPTLLLVPSFSGAESLFLPLIIVALLLDAAIISIWYMLGSLLNNGQVKASARDEFYQLGGTVLITIIIIAFLTSFSSIFSNILGSSPLLSPTTVNAICENVMSTSQLDILGKDGAFMSGPKSGTTTFPGLCNMVDPSQQQTVTTKVDYPLAVTGVIIANLTNQSMHNFDSAFVVDSYFGFLSGFAPNVTWCWSDIPPAWQCYTPIPNPAAMTGYVGLSFAPYAGLEVSFKNMVAIGSLLNGAYIVSVAQMILVVLFIFVWPYLLFIGLVLRSNPFTRKIGGLLIAAAIGMVLFYPLTYALEYLNLSSSSQPQAGSASYGYNYVTSIPGRDAVVCPGEGTSLATSPPQANPPTCASGDEPACSSDMPYTPICVDSLTNEQVSSDSVSCPPVPLPPDVSGPPNPLSAPAPTCNYTVNFYVQPSIQDIAMHYNCWPVSLSGGSESLIAAEFIDIGLVMVPFYSAISAIASGIEVPSSVPSLPGFTCTESGAVHIPEMILQAYGIIGVSAYLLPLLNLFISLSAILGVSGLLGGDTSLAGLSKLL